MARSSMQLAVTAAPDSRKRLSEGTLVEANVRARLLGIPLLKLEATIVLVPAGLTAAPPARRDAPVRRSRRQDAAGRGLAEAVRSIDEAARTLADVRRNGSH
jgi:hypothetical protein